MKLALIVIGITIFMIVNSYNDDKYIKILKQWKKYYQIGFYIFLGISILVFLKKNPADSYSLLKHAHKAIKYMPIEKDSADLLTPIFDISKHLTKDNNQIAIERMNNSGFIKNSSQGTKSTKRCVSETKKKFVASNQNWQCAHCQIKLPAWFEVDHKKRLEHGGDNHITNLEALCRDCHGKKTSIESML